MQEERQGRLQVLLAARRVKRTLVLALLGGVLSVGAGTLSGSFPGRVVGVTDGDSVVVLKEQARRMLPPVTRGGPMRPLLIARCLRVTATLAAVGVWSCGGSRGRAPTTSGTLPL